MPRTNSTMDVLQESQIDDLWNVNWDRQVSGPSSMRGRFFAFHVGVVTVVSHFVHVQEAKPKPQAGLRSIVHVVACQICVSQRVFRVALLVVNLFL